MRVSKAVFAAICSAIAAKSDPIPLYLSIDSIDAGSWSWLAFVEFCGMSVIPSLTIWKAALTKFDISSIAAVLRCCYPQLGLQSGSIAHCPPQYDFVDIQKGTEVWLEGFDVDDAFVLLRSYRCRAFFRERDHVEVVIPGYGICKTRIGSDVSRAARALDMKKQPPCGIRSLDMCFVAIESDPLAVDLFALIGRNLQSLTLISQMQSNDSSIDLSMLSAASPQLTCLHTVGLDVMISAHNESLRLWPVRKLIVEGIEKLSDLILFLRNPKSRMARELVELGVMPPEDQNFDDREMRNLTSHDGEFLRLAKEKFPIQSKISMISIVCSAGCTADDTKALHRILSQIFRFASTPEQRSVGYWSEMLLENPHAKLPDLMMCSSMSPWRT